MPQSRREQIVREILARIATAVSPIVVLRQPTTAIPREKTPALVVAVESDTPVKRANDRMERDLIVRVTGFARDPVDGYAVADDLVCRAHAALMADPALGDLLTELKAYPIPGGQPPRRALDEYGGVAIPFQLNTPGGMLSFFSTTTVFGTPVDVTLSELTLETFFPADAQTAQALRDAAAALPA